MIFRIRETFLIRKLLNEQNFFENCLKGEFQTGNYETMNEKWILIKVIDINVLMYRKSEWYP